MIVLLEARNFRMLRISSVALHPFQVLVGQNATGKSTFLGALQLIADALRGGAKFAVASIAPTFYDLCFRPDKPISLAVEIAVPEEAARRYLRYEIEIGIDVKSGLRVLHENLFILPSPSQPSRFSDGVGLPFLELLEAVAAAHPIVHESAPRTWRKVVSKTKEGRDYFRDEKTAWNSVFRFGPDKAALGSLPEDPDRFPLSIAARNALRDGIRALVLNTAEMRSSSAPGASTKMALDGSNLPHVVHAFQKRDPILFEQWVKQVAVAVEGLETVSVREREEDRHLILEARFSGEHREPVPSWMLSDGTLRLMALTLINFAATEDDLDAYLIEEPENGLHPLAIQVVYDALSRPAANTQILCATHSPILLAQTKLEETLTFRRAPEGYAIVRRGPEIPELQEWSGRESIADLFVTGVLA